MLLNRTHLVFADTPIWRQWSPVEALWNSRSDIPPPPSPHSPSGVVLEKHTFKNKTPRGFFFSKGFPRSRPWNEDSHASDLLEKCSLWKPVSRGERQDRRGWLQPGSQGGLEYKPYCRKYQWLVMALPRGQKVPDFPPVREKGSSSLRAVLQRRATGIGYWDRKHREEGLWCPGTQTLPTVEGNRRVSAWDKKERLTYPSFFSLTWSYPTSISAVLDFCRGSRVMCW